MPAASSSPDAEHVTCAIAGCGPGGAILGLILARAGVKVTVLEKHADFLRDFRGDTIHPSTTQVMYELGLAEAFLRLPAQRSRRLVGVTDDGEYVLADFGRLPGRFRFLGFLPQWDFLDFVTDEAAREPTFELRRSCEATGLVWEGDRVAGLRCRPADGAERELRTDLVVVAEGRNSRLRAAAGLVSRQFGTPMDVLWFRISRRPEDREGAFGRLAVSSFLAVIDRGDYWQIAYLIPKGALERVRARGLEELRDTLGRLLPFLADRTAELGSWDDLKLLDVRIDRLAKWWRPGLLCIGDAAHAMSPMGGVGINLAIQDAVAAANVLAEPLLAGRVTVADLAAIQRRRTIPTVITQTLQRVLQRALVAPRLSGRRASSTPVGLRLLARFPALQVVPALLVGRGVLPEHVRVAGARRAPEGPCSAL